MPSTAPFASDDSWPFISPAINAAIAAGGTFFNSSADFGAALANSSRAAFVASDACFCISSVNPGVLFFTSCRIRSSVLDTSTTCFWSSSLVALFAVFTPAVILLTAASIASAFPLAAASAS